jgi:hypothetical protein
VEVEVGVLLAVGDGLGAGGPSGAYPPQQE